MHTQSMQKSWLTLGGSVISLFVVVSLYLNTERQQLRTTFQVSLRSLLPVMVGSSPGNVDTNRWSMPAYQDKIAAWPGQQASITLDEADFADYQQAIESNHAAGNLELPDSYGLVHDAPLFITQLKEGLASLGDHHGQLQGLRPILQPQLFAVNFHASDRTSIERYANRQHLSEGALEFRYLDPSTVELLSGFRRVLIDDIATTEGNQVAVDDEGNPTGERLPRPGLEVAPGGGRYWIEDPNAALW